MTKVLNGIDELATHLLDELESGHAFEIDVTARDAATGSLLMLLLAVHDVAVRRSAAVVVSQPNEATVRLFVPSVDH